ncbi:Myosin IE [Mycena indigotica]|uniref:Myosin IE n=1 Tax=Mycena indigotica TaxID=2126181 RepID=A0A8H6SWB7_9AGAR|nr:Myosin IE [Mycena indigotica]KAF7307430.1 Myosin IE [Mycena indigotica]
MTDPALMNHIVSRLEADINFLVSQNQISHADAAAFLQKLPSSSNAPAMSMPTPAHTPSPYQAPVTMQGRAIWPYNENGQEGDDLSFSKGDIIEIVKEENADWWLGRHNGKEALFPSAYVEKIASAPQPPARNVPPVSKKPYKPFMAAHHGRDAPPPQNIAPTGPTNSIGLQQDVQGQQEKKSKYGKYGETVRAFLLSSLLRILNTSLQMAHSAAGGVGFGAGAAIGGGLVRAIF